MKCGSSQNAYILLYIGVVKTEKPVKDPVQTILYPFLASLFANFQHCCYISGTCVKILFYFTDTAFIYS